MKVILALVACCLAYAARADKWLHASEFTLSSPWSLLVNADAPFGYWYAAPGTTTNILRIDIDWETNFPAGQYAFFLKSSDYDYYWRLHVEAGGASATNYTSNRDQNGRWSTRTVINAFTNFSTTSFVLSNTPVVGLKAGVHGVFITSAANSVILETDAYMPLEYPSTNDWDHSTDGKNLIPNGSFETGIRRLWAVHSNDRKVSIKDTWVESDAHHGTRSVALSPSSGESIEFQHAPIQCASNRLYTLSAWIRSTNGNPTIQMRLKSPLPGVTNNLGQVTTTTNVSYSASNSWRQLTVTTRVLDYPYPEIVPIIAVTGTGSGQTVWIDEVSLSDTLATNYVSEAAVEHTLWPAPTNYGNIYYVGSGVDVPLIIRNATNAALSGRIYWTATDGFLATAASGSVTYSVASGELTTNTITLPQLPGSYRIVAWDPVNGGRPDEIQITVIPPPATDGTKIGQHSNPQGWQVRMAKRLGFQLFRALSPAALFRWQFNEPSNNAFDWPDDEVSAFQTNGTQLLGNISATCETWARRTWFRITNASGSFSPGETVSSSTATGLVALHSGTNSFTRGSLYLTNVTGTFIGSLTGASSGTVGTMLGSQYNSVGGLDVWPRYISNLVSHHVTTVTNWEVLNEPNQSSTTFANGDAGITSDFSVAAIQMISAIQTNANIVALGGVFDTNWAATVLSNIYSAGLSNAVDSVSFHWYPGNEVAAKGTVELFQNGFGKPSINSESGEWDFGSYMSYGMTRRNEGVYVEGYRSGDRLYRGLSQQIANHLRNHIMSIGDGALAVYSYDMRVGAHNPDSYTSEPSIIEHDDSISARGQALAILNWITAGRTTMGRVHASTNVIAWGWSGSGQDVITLYHAASTTNRALVTLPGGFPPYSRLRSDGRTIGTDEAAFTLGIMPEYLVLDSGSATNFLGATITSPTTDTVAPLLAITEWPRRNADVQKPQQSFRWAGLNDTAKPDTGMASRRLLYRSRLDAGPWSDWTEYANLSVPSDELPFGSHTIYVDAMDLSSNVVSAEQVFWRQSTGRGTANSLRATTITVR